MGIFSFFYHEIIFRPIFNGLIFFYTALPLQDFGLAVILLVVAVRLLLLPLTMAQARFQEVHAHLQPRIQEIQKKFKNDRERQQKEILELYRKENLNPLMGLFSLVTLVIQLFVLIGIFQVLRRGFEPGQLSILYPFVSKPNVFDPSFFGWLDLSKSSYFLALLAGVSQFIQTKLILPHSPQPQGGELSFATAFQKQALWVFPILTVWIASRFPAALPLSWTVMNIFAIVQQELVRRKKHKYGNVTGRDQNKTQGVSGVNGN